MGRIHIDKTKKKLYYSFFTLAFAGMFLFVVQLTMDNILSANAEGDSASFGYEEEEADLTVDYNMNYGNDLANTTITNAVAEQIGYLPPNYTSSYASRQEDQGTENLCWAYSFTTTVESSINKKKNKTGSDSVELSVKQLDYLLSKNGFSDNNNNVYYKKLESSIGLNRSLKGTGNFVRASIVSSGKHSPVDFGDFSGTNQAVPFSTISNQEGDYLLSDYELVDKFMYHNENEKLNEGDNGASLPIYNRDLVIKHIKKAIIDNGAVAVTTHFNKDNCGYYDAENGNYTYIDKTTRGNSSICGSGHAITLIGWDDTFTYQNGNDNTGAFIVLDSSNASIKQYLGYQGEVLHEHLAYESAIPSFFILKDVEEIEYDNVYDYTDYKGRYVSDGENQPLRYVSQNNITPQNNEFIYEFDTGGSAQDIRKISFFQKIYMGGAYYRVSIINNGVEHPIDNSLVYTLPGQQSIILENPITVNGIFAIKIVARTPNTAVISANPALYLGRYQTSGCVNKNEEELVRCLFDGDDPLIPTIGYDINNTEKKYDYATVYTDSRKFNIRFVDEESRVLQESEMDYNETPVFNGQIPEKESTNEFDYTPSWDPEIVPATSDAEYRLIYTPKQREYTITFLDDKGNSIANQIEYWDDPITPPNAEKSDDVQYIYEFKGWSDGETFYDKNTNLPNVSGNKTYTAIYDTTLKKYIIKFKNYDHSNLPNGEVEVAYGSVPEYNSTPTRQPDKTASAYTFLGWSSDGGNTVIPKDHPRPAVTCEVASDCVKTYEAVFEPTYIEYQITFRNEEGTFSDTKTYHYHEKINIPTAPKKEASGSYEYVFIGWDPSISEGGRVEEDKIYTAKYARSYTIYYMLDGGTNSSNNPTAYTSLDQIIFNAPTKSGYTFVGWYVDEDFSGKKVTGIAKGSTGRITLYAKWEKNTNGGQQGGGDDSDDEEVGTVDPDKKNNGSENTEKNGTTNNKTESNGTTKKTTADIPSTSGTESTTKASETATPKNPNTGNDTNQSGSIQGDFYLGVLSIGAIGFMIYLIKSRRKTKTRTKKYMKF